MLARHPYPPLLVAGPRPGARLLLVLACALLAPSLAGADKPRVAVTPFLGGAQAKAAEKVVVRSLRDRFEVVAGAAGPGGPAGRRAGQRPRKAAVRRSPAKAGPMGAAGVVIDGAIVKRRLLLVAVKNTSRGTVQRLSWPITGRTLSRAIGVRIATEVPAAVDAALRTTAPPPGGGGTIDPLDGLPTAPAVPPPPLTGGRGPSTNPPQGTGPSVAGVTTGPGAPPPAGQTEPTPAPSSTPSLTQPASAPRPPWAPFLDLEGSYLLTARRFAFAQAELPRVASGTNSGVRISATFFPGATMAAGSPGLGKRALAGIGLGVTGELMFRPDIALSPCANLAPGGGCLDKFATSEYRVEGGLRWRWNITGRDDRPDLRASIEYGLHHFSIARRTVSRGDGTTYETDVGPPDVEYRYITIGLGTRVPLGARFALNAQLNYHALLDTGPIGSPAGYGTFGKGGGYGLRGRGGVEARIASGLYLGLSGFYERYALSFGQPPAGADTMARGPCGEPHPCSTSGGATDQFFGGAATLSYRY